MKLIGSICEIAFTLIVADFLYVAQISNCANDFRRCYNTSSDMHCFDVQYDNSNNRLLTTYFDNARQRCKDLNSNLIIIKDEETNQFLGQFLSIASNPTRGQYIWTDAYRINDYDKTYRWQWLNSTLQNLSASDVYYSGYTWYVAALGLQNWRFTLLAQQPYFNNNYICEYAASNCSSFGSSSQRMFNGRCYIATNEKINWYEARNWCLKGGGDLASFVNVTSIDFKSWLGSDPNVRYWIGLRFARYIWKESGEDVKFSKWIPNYADWTSPCLSVCFNCIPRSSWLPKDCSIVDSIYVVCHTVISIVTTTTSKTAPIAKTTTSSNVAVSDTTRDVQKDTSAPSSSRTANVSLGIGLGVGLGVPLVMVTIVSIILAIKYKRSTTLQGRKTRNGGIDLDSVREQPVGQVNELPQDQYQQLRHGLDNSSETMYEELRVAPIPNYENVN